MPSLKNGFVILSFILLSCDYINKDSKGTLNTTSVQSIVFPDSLISQQSLLDSAISLSQLIKKPLKVVTYLKGDCPVCIYELKEWSVYIKTRQCLKNAKFLFIVYSNDAILLKHQVKEINFDFPIFVMTNDSFYKINKLPFENRYHTFLLDKSNKVLIAGSPIVMPEVKTAYENIK